MRLKPYFIYILSSLAVGSILTLLAGNCVLAADTLATSSQAVFSERLPILMYHYIEAPTATTTLPGLYLNPSLFASQLQVISQNHYHTVFMSAVAESLRSGQALAKGSVALSFDDGYEDFYTNAFSLLKKYQAKATIYIIINRLGQPGYLTKEQIKEMADSGLVEIGSHTFNHPDLRKLKDKDAYFEINASRRILRELSGQPVLTFAYPFGDYKPSFFPIASSTGYLAAVSVNPGSLQKADNLWLLPRLRPDNLSGPAFARWLKKWSH